MILNTREAKRSILLMQVRSSKSLLSQWKAIEESNKFLLDTSFGSFAGVTFLLFWPEWEAKIQHPYSISTTKRKQRENCMFLWSEFSLMILFAFHPRFGLILAQSLLFLRLSFHSCVCTMLHRLGLFVFRIFPKREGRLIVNFNGHLCEDVAPKDKLQTCYWFSVLFGTAGLCHHIATASASNAGGKHSFPCLDMEGCRQ